MRARPKTIRSPLTYTLRKQKDGTKSIALYLRGTLIASWVSYRDIKEIEATIAKMQQRFIPEHLRGGWQDNNTTYKSSSK